MDQLQLFGDPFPFVAELSSKAWPWPVVDSIALGADSIGRLHWSALRR